MEHKLTIGIPTFNGSKYISGAIESVLSNVYPEIDGRLEILVSDNASNDNTSSIMHAYVEKYPQLISYHRNQTNIGFAANIETIFKKASGEYVQILGDDDYLKNNSLRKIFNVLDTNRDVSVVLLSISFLDIRTDKEIEGLKFDSDKLCKDGDSFFQISKWGTSAISSIIVKKSDWLEQNLLKYAENQWIHVAAVMNILKKDKWAYIISDNLVTVRISNPRWQENFGNGLYVGMEHLKLFSEMIDLGYSYETFAFYLNDRFNTNLQNIFTFRAKHISDNIPTAILMIHFFYRKPTFWLLHLPLLFTPYFLTEIPISVYRKMRFIFSKIS